jgi:uncharacterized protein (UPF0335 family)
MNNETPKHVHFLTAHTIKVLDHVEFDTVSLNTFVLNQILTRIARLEAENAALKERVTELETSGGSGGDLTGLTQDIQSIKSFLTNNFVNAITGATFP